MKMKLALAGSATGVAVLLGGVAVAHGQVNSADETAARQALLSAIAAKQVSVVPARAGVAAYSGTMSARASSTMVTKGRGLLATHFTGGALQDAQRDLEAGAAQLTADPTFRSLDAGADHLVISAASKEVSGYHFIGTVRTWSALAQVQRDGRSVSARPSNVLDISADVIKVAGTWKVSSYRWSFHPGSEP